MQVLYLACPYTSDSPFIRHLRQDHASRAAAELMDRGFVVFSPITHGHQVVKHLSKEHPHDHDFWMGQCIPILARCDAVVILPMNGWESSRGLRDEVKAAQARGIPVYTYETSPQFRLRQVTDFPSFNESPST